MQDRLQPPRGLLVCPFSLRSLSQFARNSPKRRALELPPYIALRWVSRQHGTSTRHAQGMTSATEAPPRQAAFVTSPDTRATYL